MDTPAWPHGARVTVLISVLLENWSPGKYPTYFPRTTPLRPGVVDYAAIQWSHFGGREGIWRLLRALEPYGFPATVFCNALSAELYPEALDQITRAGYDVAGHGYAQDQYLLDLSPDEQAATIRSCLDILEKACGERPTGWVTPVYGNDAHTTELLVQAGLAWHCDALDTSLPRRDVTPSGSIVAIPWCDFVDNRVLRASPRDYVDVYRGTFDYLYQREPGGLLHLAVHSHFGGRPLMTAALHEVLTYLSGFSDVWFASHGELASWIAGQPAT